MWRGTCRALACSLHVGLVQVDHDFGIRVRAVVVGRHLHRCRFLSYCREILKQRWSPSGFVFSDSVPGLAGSESGEMLQYSGEEFEALNYPFIQIGTSQ